ncbi:hypothetical protein ACIBM3_32540 [Rhodococcus erythropolis]|uniref:hypothetical protein n=1 Tax=Rhodococcus erythropolis TaxID=1833 RepID=UPI0037955991
MNTPVTATPDKLAQRRTFAGVMIMPLFMLIALPLAFIGLFHSPSPNHMNIAVIDSSPASTGIQSGLSSSVGEQFDVTLQPNASSAREALANLDIRGAYDPSTGELFTAGAGNVQASAAVQQVFAPIAQSQGIDLTVVDTNPLPSGDSVGSGLLYLGVGSIFGGFLTATVVAIAVPGLARKWQVTTITVMSLVAAAVQVFYGWKLFGMFEGQAIPAFFTLFGIAVVCGLVNLGGIGLIGPAMIPISLLIFMMLGIPASGLAIPLDLAPSFYGAIHPFLPTSSGFDALKRIVYFDGHGIAGNFVTLGIWALIGAALIWWGSHRDSKPTENVWSDPELDEAVVATGAAVAVG